MAYLIILQGPPCSGKSTWARSEVERAPKRRIIVSRDDIRHSMGDYWNTEREPLVNAVEDFTIREAIRRSHTVIVDGTNLEPSRIAALKQLAIDIDTPCEFKEFYVSFPEAVRRDANSDRRHHLGEAAIRQFYEAYYREKYEREIEENPGPYLAKPATFEARLILSPDGSVSWHPTPSDLDSIRKMSALRFPFSSIALGLEVPVSEVARLLNTPGNSAYEAYQAGKVESEILYRDRIRRAAEAGDIEAIKVLEEWAKNQRKEELGF
ncbi:MAG: AAA family ATPase [Bacteroidales bacterium]|nr:AAA family ATPase [Bacteroidales bacterium]